MIEGCAYRFTSPSALALQYIMSAKFKKASPVAPAPRNDTPIRTSVLNGIRLLVFAAMGISAYLAYVSMTGDKVVGCGPDSGCDQVMNSRWAYWLNVPVSLFALMVYSLFLGATFRLGLKREARVQRTTWAWLLGCALLVLGSAIWFVSLQGFVVKAFCPFCMAAHACGALASILVVANAPHTSSGAKPWQLENLVFISPRAMRRVVIVAVAALATLIFGQLRYERRTMVVKPVPIPTNGVPAAAASPGASSGAASAAVSAAMAVPSNAVNSAVVPAPTRRLLPIYGGKFEIDAFELPIIGSPTNQHLIVSLFDYTCHHCRAMHSVLTEVQQFYSNRLGIISLPMPLDPECNHTMTRTIPAHTNACAYARLGLAVWRADRTKHPEFDRWLMEGENPPAIDAAVGKAMELVGAPKLAEATRDSWVAGRLKANVDIYEVAFRAGQGRMPQLVVGQNVALGSYAKPELLQLLSDNLGLKAEP